jgi:hypothetical protein
MTILQVMDLLVVKKNENLPTLKKVTNFEKRTQSYQVLKTYFDPKKARLFATPKSLSY